VQQFHLDRLAEQFSASTLPHGAWTHTAHLRIGAWHVHHFGANAALAMLRTGIRRLNDFHGTPNSETHGYHETITVAYVRLIAEFLATADAHSTIEARVDRLLASPLALPSMLTTFWTPALLFSPRARAEWVAPDLAPLELERAMALKMASTI
jgi:hypothetical protein